jgi:ATP-dependent RNA helicase DDX56/DBP9
LTIKCSKIIKCVDLSAKLKTSSLKHTLSQNPDIIVSTPARILTHLNEKNINLKESLEMLVIDEADLMFSFGFEEDVKKILGHHLPTSYQVNKCIY